jgi:predicted nucleic acid-binding protein
MVALLAAIEDGAVQWLGSEYLDFEVTQDPDRERVRRIQALLSLIHSRVPASEAVVRRAREIELGGLRGLDALHVASAEVGRAELMVTTDDRMLRRAARANIRLRVRLVTPVQAMALVPRRRTR